MRLMSGLSVPAAGLLLAVSQTFAERQLNNLVTELLAVDSLFDEGGYEVQPLWTEVGRGIERVIKDGIDEILS